LNHEWTRMGTNLRSSGFPARDLCCRGCADRGLCRLSGSREAAKPRRETHKFSVRFSAGGIQFSVFGQASRGRESAGAGPGRWCHAKPRRQMRCHGCFFATDEHGFSRIIAEGDVVGDFYSQLSLVSSLWQGCHRPLTPDPSPPFRGRGEDVVFFYGYESTRREGEAPAEPQVV